MCKWNLIKSASLLVGLRLMNCTLEPLSSGPLNSGKSLINSQARLDKWIFHYQKNLISEKTLNSRRYSLDEKIHY